MASLRKIVDVLKRQAGQQEPAYSLETAHLLDRFVDRHDEEAFAELVQRYAPMVWTVCRQVLRQQQDAEDAFQATFLILVRKAHAIRNAAALGSWLHQVALGTALDARKIRSRFPQELPDREAMNERFQPLLPTALLHEEINRLPDKYRHPIVMCYLEGRTTEEAAVRLGCPKGTILTRLAWARHRLRTRLVSRGNLLSASALTGLLAPSAAPVVREWCWPGARHSRERFPHL